MRQRGIHYWSRHWQPRRRLAACAAARRRYGYLDGQSLEASEEARREFRQGLKDNGFIDGDKVAIESYFSGYQMERLPELLAELVRRRVALIVAGGGPISVAASKATTTIPVVFMVPEDPVRLGLVDSLALPGRNMTGVNFFATETVTKRLGFARVGTCSAAYGRAPESGRGGYCRDTQRGRIGWPPWDCKFRFTKRAAARRSMQPLRAWRAIGLTPSLSAAVPSSGPDVSSWPTWPHAMPSRRFMRVVATPRPAG